MCQSGHVCEITDFTYRNIAISQETGDESVTETICMELQLLTISDCLWDRILFNHLGEGELRGKKKKVWSRCVHCNQNDTMLIAK